MRVELRIASAGLAVVAFFGALVAPAPLAQADASSSKIVNLLDGGRALAASEGQFIEAALKPAVKGSCEMLSPDPGFVEEMLVRFDPATGKKLSPERRVALVVGNGAYQSVSKLTNPPNDAASMAKMFRALGFTVFRAVDATEKSLDDCFTKFKGYLEASDTKGAKADIALFFYAGHGVQLTSTADNEKRNYMLSVDAAVDPATGKSKGFRQVDRVLTEMRAHSKQAVFLYDACRNAPYGEGVVKEADGEATRQYDASGAAPIDADESERASQAGLFIAYATSPGKTADDAWGPEGSTHSPFTEALLKDLAAPGSTIDQALAKTFNAVGQLTNWKQTPWTNSSLTVALNLNGRQDAAAREAHERNLAETALRRSREGDRGNALIAALAAMPKSWAPSYRPPPEGSARAALYKVYHDKFLRLKASTGGTAQARLSNDERLVAVTTTTGAVLLLSADVGGVRRTLHGHTGRVFSAEFSHDDAELITAGDDKTVRIWDVKSGAEAHKVVLPGPVYHAGFSPDGGRFSTLSADGASSLPEELFFSTSASGTGVLRVWTTVTRSAVIVGRNLEIGRVRFSPDGSLIAAPGANNKIMVWNAASGAETAVLTGLPDRATSVAISPDGFIAGGGRYGDVAIWAAHAAAGSPPIRKQKTGVLPVNDLAFSPDGKMIAAASGDGEASVWSAGDGARVASLRTAETTASVQFSKDGKRILTASADGSVQVWPFKDPRERLAISHEAFVFSAAFSPDDSMLATTSENGAVRLSRVSDGAPLRSLVTKGEEWVEDAAFSPDGALLATASTTGDSAVRIWRVSDGQLVRTLRGHISDVNAVAFSPDGATIASASFDGAVRLWSSASGALVRSFGVSDDPVWELAFSPGDGAEIATASARGATLWTTATGAKARELTGHKEGLNSVAYSRDGARLVTASLDQTAKVWDVRSGRLLANFAEHQASVNAAAFGADGARIATGGSDNIVRLWDAETGAQLDVFEGHQGEILDINFNGDGALFVSTAAETTARIWNAGIYGQDLLAAAQALLTEDMQAEVERMRIRYWVVDPKLLE